jgi:flavodoxin
MKALVVYDSFFGNTEKVAQAIGEILGAPVRKVSDVQPAQLAGLDLLVVGSPTRGFRPSPAITSLLQSVPRGALQGLKVAAFDTRAAMEEVSSAVLRMMVKWFGYAAEKMARRLQDKGGILVLPPAGFIVKDTEGPLKEGEVERAVEWAGELNHTFTSS